MIGQLDEQVAQMLAEAAGQDAAEDAAEQDRSDSGGPPELRNRTQRLAKLKAAKQRLDAEAAEAHGFKINGERTGSRLGDRRAPRRGEAAEAWVAEWQDQPDRPRQPDHAYPRRFRQAFNGQAVVTSDQVIVAAEVVPENTDLDAFHPMLDAARGAWTRPGWPIRSGRWWLMPAIPTSRTGPGLPRRAIARSCWWRCRVWARSRPRAG